MRPRLIAVDDQALSGADGGEVLDASMRPRLIAVDDVVDDARQRRGGLGFNEATADRRG